MYEEEGAMDATMYLSGWINLLSRVSMVTVAEVLPASSVTTGSTGS